MNVFPSKELSFRLTDNKSLALKRLIRRTEISENLAWQKTQKSFRGIILDNDFKLISSEIGVEGICVMTGHINDNRGYVRIEFLKAFKYLYATLMLFIIGCWIVLLINNEDNLQFNHVLLLILQLVFIRYVLISLSFRYSVKRSLDKLRDILDIEWTKK